MFWLFPPSLTSQVNPASVTCKNRTWAVTHALHTCIPEHILSSVCSWKPDSAPFCPLWLKKNQCAKCLFWSSVGRSSTKERINCVPIGAVRCLAQAAGGRYLQFCWPLTEICFCVISAWMGDIKFAKIIEPIAAERLPTPFWQRRVGAPNKGSVCFKIGRTKECGGEKHTLARPKLQIRSKKNNKKIHLQSNNNNKTKIGVY